MPGVLVFLPRSWVILENFQFLAKILVFLDLFAKILALNLAQKSMKSNIMPVDFREENHSCFYNYKLSYTCFSSYVNLTLIL